MNKKVLVFALLAVAFITAGCGNQTQQNNSNLQTKNSSATEIIAKADKIEVVDFHGTNRCYSCQIVEQYARQTLEENFPQELASGKITFQSINGELAENQALVIKYQARGSSLFINAIRDGKDNIEEDTMVWRLIGNEQKFKEHLKNKIDNLWKI